LKSLLKVAIIVLFAVSANAQTKKSSSGSATQPLLDQFSGAGYGLSGCGLGSIIFGAKPGMVQIPSATTNGIYGIQTFGITSGTSNCEIPRMGQTAAVYIEANREVVMKDASRGEGETMMDLALIYNCDNTELFGQKIQNNFGQIFKSTNAYDSSRAIINTIKADSALAANCKIAG